MTKYKELYDLSLALIDAERGRFSRVESKVTGFLGVLALLAGFISSFLWWGARNVLPPDGVAEWLIVVLGLVAVICFGASFVSFLRALRVARIDYVTLDAGMVSFFRDNKLVDIYYSMAKRNSEIYQNNLMVTNKKIVRLTWGYRFLVLLVVISLCEPIILGYHEWSSSASKNCEEATMTDQKESDQKPESSEEPDETIEAPKPTSLQEGYSEGETKQEKKKEGDGGGGN